MGKLFAIDGVMYKIGTTIIDLFYMNFLWFVFTILGLGITGGAATSALYYVMQRRADNLGVCSFSEFLFGFKRNFVKATKVWLLMLSILAILIINIESIPFFQSIIRNSYVTGVLLVIQLLALIEWTMISVYIFGIVTKQDVKIKVVSLIKIAIVLAHKHLLTTITCIALILVLTIGILHIPIIFCAGISGYVLLTSYLFKGKLERFMPEKVSIEVRTKSL